MCGTAGAAISDRDESTQPRKQERIGEPVPPAEQKIQKCPSEIPLPETLERRTLARSRQIF